MEEKDFADVLNTYTKAGGSPSLLTDFFITDYVNQKSSSVPPTFEAQKTGNEFTDIRLSLVNETGKHYTVVFNKGTEAKLKGMGYTPEAIAELKGTFGNVGDAGESLVSSGISFNTGTLSARRITKLGLKTKWLEEQGITAFGSPEISEPDPGTLSFGGYDLKFVDDSELATFNTRLIDFGTDPSAATTVTGPNKDAFLKNYTFADVALGRKPDDHRNLVLMSYGDLAKMKEHSDPALSELGKKADLLIQQGKLNPLQTYYDDKNTPLWRTALPGENLDGRHIRALQGDVVALQDSYLDELGDSVNDALMDMLGSGIQIFGVQARLIDAYLTGGGVLGYSTGLTKFSDSAYDTYANWARNRYSQSSLENKQEWNSSFTNLSKGIVSGVTQMAAGGGLVGGATRTAGRLMLNKSLEGTAKHIAAKSINTATRISTTSAFAGMAGYSANEEARKLGLTPDEAFLMSGIAMALVPVTEAALGQPLQKIAGTMSESMTGQIGKAVVKSAKKMADGYGIQIGEVVSNPSMFKKMLLAVPNFMTKEFDNKAARIIQGYVQEGSQEVLEDFSMTIAKMTFDAVSDVAKYNVQVNKITEDLLGSFVIGGLTRTVSTLHSDLSNKRAERDLDGNISDIFRQGILAGRYGEIVKDLEVLHKYNAFFGVKVDKKTSDAIYEAFKQELSVQKKLVDDVKPIVDRFITDGAIDDILRKTTEGTDVKMPDSVMKSIKEAFRFSLPNVMVKTLAERNTDLNSLFLEFLTNTDKTNVLLEKGITSIHGIDTKAARFMANGVFISEDFDKLKTAFERSYSEFVNAIHPYKQVAIQLVALDEQLQKAQLAQLVGSYTYNGIEIKKAIEDISKEISSLNKSLKTMAEASGYSNEFLLKIKTITEKLVITDIITDPSTMTTKLESLGFQTIINTALNVAKNFNKDKFVQGQTVTTFLTQLEFIKSYRNKRNDVSDAAGRRKVERLASSIDDVLADLTKLETYFGKDFIDLFSTVELGQVLILLVKGNYSAINDMLAAQNELFQKDLAGALVYFGTKLPATPELVAYLNELATTYDILEFEISDYISGDDAETEVLNKLLGYLKKNASIATSVQSIDASLTSLDYATNSLISKLNTLAGKVTLSTTFNPTKQLSENNAKWIFNIKGVDSEAPNMSIQTYIAEQQRKFNTDPTVYENLADLERKLNDFKGKLAVANMLKMLDSNLIKNATEDYDEALDEVNVSIWEADGIIASINKLIDASKANMANPVKDNAQYIEKYIAQSLDYLKSINDSGALPIPITFDETKILTLADINALEKKFSAELNKIEEDKIEAFLNDNKFDLNGEDKGLFTRIYAGVTSHTAIDDDAQQHKMLYFMYLFRNTQDKIHNQLNANLSNLMGTRAWPSIEQMLTERVIMQKLLNEPSKLDEYLFKKLELSPNTIVARGGAGAGKTDYIVKLVNNMAATAVVTSAAFDTVKGIDFGPTTTVVQLPDLEATIKATNPAVVIIDEHSIISTNLLDFKKLTEAYPDIKFVLLGDEQQSPPMGTETLKLTIVNNEGKTEDVDAFVNFSQVYYNGRYEMTNPILKTFRSPKIDSTDVQLGARKVISGLFEILQSTEGGNLRERLQALYGEFAKSNLKGTDIFNVIRKYIPFMDKVTSFELDSRDLIKDGVRKMGTNDDLLKSFAAHYKQDNAIKLIVPEALHATFSELRPANIAASPFEKEYGAYHPKNDSEKDAAMAFAHGKLLDHLEATYGIPKVAVLTASESQGKQFSHVYVMGNMFKSVAQMEETVGIEGYDALITILTAYQTFYTAISREQVSLTYTPLFPELMTKQSEVGPIIKYEPVYKSDGSMTKPFQESTQQVKDVLGTLITGVEPIAKLVNDDAVVVTPPVATVVTPDPTPVKPKKPRTPTAGGKKAKATAEANVPTVTDTLAALRTAIKDPNIKNQAITESLTDLDNILNNCK